MTIVVVGPNSPISNGSLMPAIETQLDFSLSFAKKIQCQGIKSVVVSAKATADFIEHKDAVMQNLTFSGSCNSWYGPVQYVLFSSKVANPVAGTRAVLLMGRSSAFGQDHLITLWSVLRNRVCRTLNSLTTPPTDLRLLERVFRFLRSRIVSWGGISEPS